ncbi:hypothetical protein G6514_007467 [Epicoccum nigrum]|nr:hypothetical protein G6514_007467 [Epicoccum nigrum]
MASPNRGNVPPGLQSKSTPNLPTLKSLEIDGRSAAGHQHSRLAVSPPRIPSPLSPLSNDAASVEQNEENVEDLFAMEESEGSGSESGEEEEEKEGNRQLRNHDDDMRSQPASRPLYTSRSYTHLPQPSTALYPPFYNRPPVPLPPSPSLTSLLRPAFSAATSRPTTPDSSDVEYTNTPTSSTTNLHHLTATARASPTVPRASPKVPTYEYYGFAVYVLSSAAFLMYILWAYVPAPLLHQMGIWWYPDRWWALAVPCWAVVLVVYIYVALASWNTRYLTLEMGACECLVDETAQVAVVERKTGRIVPGTGFGGGEVGWGEEELDEYRFKEGERVDWGLFWNVGTDAVMDVPIGGVCEILYGSDE